MTARQIYHSMTRRKILARKNKPSLITCDAGVNITPEGWFRKSTRTMLTWMTEEARRRNEPVHAQYPINAPVSCTGFTVDQDGQIS